MKVDIFRTFEITVVFLDYKERHITLVFLSIKLFER